MDLAKRYAHAIYKRHLNEARNVKSCMTKEQIAAGNRLLGQMRSVKERRKP